MNVSKFSPITTEFLDIPNITRVIFNNPATIVFWDDGTKTVVKTMTGDKYDPLYGTAMATTKKLYGSNSKFKRVVEKFIPTVEIDTTMNQKLRKRLNSNVKQTSSNSDIIHIERAMM